MKTCPNCGKQEESNNVFVCSACGGTLVKPERVFCPACGAQVEEDMNFCPKCATPLNAMHIQRTENLSQPYDNSAYSPIVTESAPKNNRNWTVVVFVIVLILLAGVIATGALLYFNSVEDGSSSQKMKKEEITSQDKKKESVSEFAPNTDDEELGLDNDEIVIQYYSEHDEIEVNFEHYIEPDDYLEAHGWCVPYEVFEEPVSGCKQVDALISVYDVEDGYPYGKWYIYLLTDDGWEERCELDYAEGVESVTSTIYLNPEETIYAYAALREEGESSNHSFTYELYNFVMY